MSHTVSVKQFDSVKDSGDRTEFATGSVRDRRAGKGLPHLIPTYPLTRLAQHFENGASKYGERNWELGQPLSSYYASCQRHLHDVLNGMEDEDHEAAVLWNMVCFIQTRKWIADGVLPKDLNDIPYASERNDGVRIGSRVPKPESKQESDTVGPRITTSETVSSTTSSSSMVTVAAPEKKITVYISGPITGQKNNNAEAFCSLADVLRHTTPPPGCVFHVLNPIEFDNMEDQEVLDRTSWEDFLSRDIPYVCKSDVIVLLPGWTNSNGACLEVFNAAILGKAIYGHSSISPNREKMPEKETKFDDGYGKFIWTVGDLLPGTWSMKPATILYRYNPRETMKVAVEGLHKKMMS